MAQVAREAQCSQPTLWRIASGQRVEGSAHPKFAEVTARIEAVLGVRVR
jgi:hypothetical protein